MKKYLLLFIVILLTIGNLAVYAVSLPDTNQPNPHGQWTPSPGTPPPRRPVATPRPTTADVLIINVPNIRNGLITIGESAYISVDYGGEARFTAGLGALEIKITGDNILPHTETRNVVRDNNGNYILDLSAIEFNFLVELRIVDASHVHEGRVVLFNEMGEYSTSIELEGQNTYHIFVEPGLYRIEIQGEYIAMQNNAPPSWMITATEIGQFVNVSLLGIHLGDSLLPTEFPPFELPVSISPEPEYIVYTTPVPETRSNVTIIVIVVVIAVAAVLLFMLFRLYNEHASKSKTPIVTDEDDESDKTVAFNSDQNNDLDVTVAEATTEF